MFFPTDRPCSAALDSPQISTAPLVPAAFPLFRAEPDKDASKRSEKNEKLWTLMKSASSDQRGDALPTALAPRKLTDHFHAPRLSIPPVTCSVPPVWCVRGRGRGRGPDRPPLPCLARSPDPDPAHRLHAAQTSRTSRSRSRLTSSTRSRGPASILTISRRTSRRRTRSATA